MKTVMYHSGEKTKKPDQTGRKLYLKRKKATECEMCRKCERKGCYDKCQ